MSAQLSKPGPNTIILKDGWFYLPTFLKNGKYYPDPETCTLLAVPGYRRGDVPAALHGEHGRRLSDRSAPLGPLAGPSWASHPSTPTETQSSFL
jgi:hypothetical protein